MKLNIYLTINKYKTNLLQFMQNLIKIFLIIAIKHFAQNCIFSKTFNHDNKVYNSFL